MHKFIAAFLIQMSYTTLAYGTGILASFRCRKGQIRLSLKDVISADTDSFFG